MLQKGGFERTVFNEIKDIHNQDELACALMKNDTLKNFIINIFWNLLQKNYEITVNDDTSKIDKFKEIIKKETLENLKHCDEDNCKIISQIGFSEVEIENILEIFLQNPNSKKPYTNFYRIESFKQIHKTTRMLTALNNPEFQAKYILNDKELLEKFISKLKKIYNLPTSFNKEVFMEIYLAHHDKPSGKGLNMLIVKLLHMSDDFDSVIQRNYGREVFSRQNVDKSKPKKSRELPNCFKDLEGNNKSPGGKSVVPRKIYGIENFLSLEGTFSKLIFENYNRISTGGISGSVYYLYFLLFKILKKEKNFTNFTKLLCIAVIDYVPLWHSLEEILLTLSIEFEKVFKFKRYTLDMEPLDYFKSIMSKELRGPTVRASVNVSNNSNSTPSIIGINNMTLNNSLYASNSSSKQAKGKSKKGAKGKLRKRSKKAKK